MFQISFVALAILVSGGAFANPTAFQRLQEQFERSEVPYQPESLGHWAGHCVQFQDPEKRWPAVYVSRMVVDPLSAYTESYSQTYFFERRNQPDFFMGFNVDQLNQYGPYRDWIQKEQWLPTFVEAGSLTNEYKLPSGGRMVRAVRVTETEFTRHYLMRVSRQSSKGSETVSYCSFSKGLEFTTPDYSTPTFRVRTGFLADTFTEIRLPYQMRAMKSLVIRKKSGEVLSLSRIEITEDDGTVMYYAPSAFEQGDALAFIKENQAPFRAAKIRFYLSGWASDLELYGEPYPVAR